MLWWFVFLLCFVQIHVFTLFFCCFACKMILKLFFKRVTNYSHSLKTHVLHVDIQSKITLIKNVCLLHNLLLLFHFLYFIIIIIIIILLILNSVLQMLWQFFKLLTPFCEKKKRHHYRLLPFFGNFIIIKKYLVEIM